MSADLFRIGVVVSPREWSVQLHAFIADHVPDVELVVVRDERAALEAFTDVLLIDDSTPWLKAPFVEAAARQGVRLVGVYDRNDGGTSRDRLAGLGLTHLVEEAMPPDDVVFLLERLRPSGRDGAVRHVRRSGDEMLPEVKRGASLAVGGPSGSGARELIVGLCAEWGEKGYSTLLVDLNETTPGIARRLGIGLYPHVLTAVDRLGSDGLGGVEAALADKVRSLPFDVIAGLPTPRDWDRLVAHDVERLLESCREDWDRVVMSTSPVIEDLQRWGDRFGVSRHVLSIADAVVGCCEPTPRGVLRYLDWLADVTALRVEVVTVLNKVARSPRIAAESRRQLLDVGGGLVDEIVEVPLDRTVSAAEWDGTLARGRRFRRGIAALAARIESSMSTRDVEVAS